MKPLKRKNYGSIPHLLNSKLGPGDHHIHEGQHKILTEKSRPGDVVYVTEKYDGSNVGITKVNDQIIPITRSGYTAISSPYKTHHDFHEWAMHYERIFDKMLLEGERICGEWMGDVVSIFYSTKSYIHKTIFFDYFNSKNERFAYSTFFSVVSGYGFKTARLLHKGNAISPNDLLIKLNGDVDPEIFTISEDPEGMVYRVENNGKFDFMAKWVRHDFIPGKYL